MNSPIKFPFQFDESPKLAFQVRRPWQCRRVPESSGVVNFQFCSRLAGGTFACLPSLSLAFPTSLPLSAVGSWAHARSATSQ